MKTWGGNALLKEVSYDFQIRLPNGKTLQVGRVDISVPAPGEAGNVTVEVVAGSAGIWSLK